MRRLPYQTESFDTVICMWNAFGELTKKQDQIKTLREIYRILRKNGFALIEVRNNKSTGYEKPDKIAGIEANPHYKHNKVSLSKLINLINIRKSKIFIDNFGGRKRLFLQFWK